MPWQVGRLTFYQINHIIFRERDEKGGIVKAVKEGLSYEELFRQTWRRRGMPEWRIDERWQDYLREASGPNATG